MATSTTTTTTTTTQARALPATTSHAPAVLTVAAEAADPALLHRSFLEQPLTVSHAKGSFLYLADGRKVLDACGGAAVAVLGHGNDEVLEAITAQMKRVSYVHTLSYTTDAAEDLARYLVGAGGGGGAGGPPPFFTRAYLVGSGSEANEAALKAARQYFVETGEPQRGHYVSRRQAYHGNTIGTMAVSTNLARKAPFGSILPANTSFVSPAYAYQYQAAGETEEAYVERLLAELRAEFLRIGPEKVISFIAEPVVGATAGCVAAPKGYFRGVRALCDEYGILLQLDEIMCGVGRTGTFFAFEQEGIVPDIVTIGKGLGGGYVPVSAMLLSEKVVDALRRGSSAFNHGHTFQAHPVAAAAGLAVQTVLQREGLVARCAALGQTLGALLRRALAGRRYVGDVRGRGLFWGVEFVQDRHTKQPFARAVGFGARVQQAALDRGVAVYPGSGTVDGSKGDHVLLAPPLTVSEDELRTLVSVLLSAYEAVEAAVDETRPSASA